MIYNNNINNNNTNCKQTNNGTTTEINRGCARTRQIVIGWSAGLEVFLLLLENITLATSITITYELFQEYKDGQ